MLETGNLARAPRPDRCAQHGSRLYLLLAERGRIGEAYNVGSGQTFAMQEVVDRLVALSGVTVEVRQRQDLVRAADTADFRADAGKLRRRDRLGAGADAPADAARYPGVLESTTRLRARSTPVESFICQMNQQWLTSIAL